MTPVSISGATSPAPRAMARIMPVRMPGLACGSTIRRIVCHFEAPHAMEASRSDRGTAASASSVATMTTGHGQERERERRPEDAAAAERRVGEAVGVEGAVDPAAHDVAEEAEAEDAEDDARDAGEVVHRDAHGRHEGPLLRVLPEVEGRDARRTGTTRIVMSRVMSTVPKIAGQMPPSVFASRGSSVTNRQNRPTKRPTRPRSPSRFTSSTRRICETGTGCGNAVPEPCSRSTWTRSSSFWMREDARAQPLGLGLEDVQLLVEALHPARELGVAGLVPPRERPAPDPQLLERLAVPAERALLDLEAGLAAPVRRLHLGLEEGAGPRAPRATTAPSRRTSRHAAVRGAVLDALEREEVLGRSSSTGSGRRANHWKSLPLAVELAVADADLDLLLDPALGADLRRRAPRLLARDHAPVGELEADEAGRPEGPQSRSRPRWRRSRAP